MLKLIVFAILAQIFQALDITWELEDYNEWNLPFAKTVEIQSNQVTGREKFYHVLDPNSYKMRVDPSAVFSVIFLKPEYFTDYTDDQLVQLDYTYLGDTPQLEYQGVWADVSILIPHSRDSTATTSVDFTIFVAIGDYPPENGLDGVLSICVTPLTYDWAEISLLGKIEEKYSWDTVYVSYSFPRTNNIYLGSVQFSTDSANVEEFTFGGQTFISDSMLETQSLFDLKTINPFLDLDMPQISFNSVLLSENQIFVTDFKTAISMTPASAATHIPKTIYDYIDENFFQYLCKNDLSSSLDLDLNIDGNFTSYASPMKSCQCEGMDYYGMPSIGFGLQVDQYDTNYAYQLEPQMFMSLPKVDPNLRVQKCSLGIWNLSELDNENLADVGSDIDQFAVGQNFIREYNMTFKYIKTQKTAIGVNSISLLMFIGAATHQTNGWTALFWVIPTILFLFAYLGYFSVLKFRRVRTESNQFEKMQKQFQALSSEEKRRIVEAVTKEAAFIEGKADAGTLDHELDVLNLQRMIGEDRRMTERGRKSEPEIPLRSSQSFVKKRQRASMMIAANRGSANLISQRQRLLSGE